MLPFAILMLLQTIAPVDAPRESEDSSLYADCVRAAEEGVPGAIDAASQWVNAGGGIAARHCLGLAYLGANKPAEAASAFEAGARVAESLGSPKAAMMYGQAGNAAIMAGALVRAEVMLTSGIVLAARDNRLKGVLMVDRARAREAQGNAAGARADLEDGVKFAPDDATGWLLLGSLARREERLADARIATATALRLSPSDPEIQLEAGNMAALEGDFAKARSLWANVAAKAPGTPAGKAAADALLRNPQ